MMYSQNFSEIIICEKCQGTGKIRVGNLREMHNHDVQECYCCDGDGSMVKVTSIRYLKKTDEIINAQIPVA